MAKLNNEWNHTFNGAFETEEDVIEFIFECIDSNKFEDSFIDSTGHGEPNEMFKYTGEDKKQALYDFMMNLLERVDKIL